MSDGSTHIDILFRNGLKEFEVLPPPDIWDSIQPALGKRKRSVTYSRVAALAAVLISVSVLSFWFTRELSRDFNGPSISLNQEVHPGGYYITRVPPVQKEAVRLAESIPETVYSGKTIESSSDAIYLKIPSMNLFLQEMNQSKLQKRSFGNYSEALRKEPVMPQAENLNTYAVSQVKESTGKGISRWAISAVASPNYFSTISGGSQNSSDDLATHEKSAVSYTGGVAFSYNLSKRISVQSGVYYSSLGQKIEGINSYSGFNKYFNAKGGSEISIQTSSGTIRLSNSDIFLRDNISSRVLTQFSLESFDPVKADLTYINSSVIQNFNYLEVPVFFKFKAIDKKLDLSLIGGLSYNMLVGNSAFTYVDGVRYSIGKTEGLSPINFSSSVGVGFEYNFSEKISLSLEPTFRYYLMPVGGVVGSNIHPYSVGIFSGLSYKF
jgi:opacity protein-like surface antigen